MNIKTPFSIVKDDGKTQTSNGGEKMSEHHEFFDVNQKPYGYYFDKISCAVKQLEHTKTEMDRLTGSFSRVWTLLGKDKASLDRLLNTEIGILEDLSITTNDMAQRYAVDEGQLLEYFVILQKRIEDVRTYKPAELAAPENPKDILDLIKSMSARLLYREQEVQSRLIKVVERNANEYALETKSHAEQCGTIKTVLRGSAIIFQGEYEHAQKVGPVKLHMIEARAIGKLIGKAFSDIREMNRVMMENVSRGYAQIAHLGDLSLLPVSHAYIRRIELLQG